LGSRPGEVVSFWGTADSLPPGHTPMAHTRAWRNEGPGTARARPIIPEAGVGREKSRVGGLRIQTHGAGWHLSLQQGKKPGRFSPTGPRSRSTRSRSNQRRGNFRQGQVTEAHAGSSRCWGDFPWQGHVAEAHAAASNSCRGDVSPAGPSRRSKGWQGARGFRDFSRLPLAQENRGQPADPTPASV
jgi:hypothetical protein